MWSNISEASDDHSHLVSLIEYLWYLICSTENQKQFPTVYGPMWYEIVIDCDLLPYEEISELITQRRQNIGLFWNLHALVKSLKKSKIMLWLFNPLFLLSPKASTARLFLNMKQYQYVDNIGEIFWHLSVPCSSREQTALELVIKRISSLASALCILSNTIHALQIWITIFHTKVMLSAYCQCSCSSDIIEKLTHVDHTSNHSL